MSIFRLTLQNILFTGFLALATGAQAQVSPKDINGARNTASDGTTLDTNVSFSLRMTLAGEDTLRNSAQVNQDVDIRVVIHPDSADLGKAADIILVDYMPPIPYMRNTDGNFVAWNGKLGTLQPAMEGITLANDLDIEIYNGQLGTEGQHRIFMGYLVEGVLYFTPTALQLTIDKAPETATPLEQATALFNDVISPRIVQGRCVVCHVKGGVADNHSSPIFVRTSTADHLTLNFEEMQWLKSFRSSNFILNKVLGFGHEGGVQLQEGSNDYNDLVTFLDLLDQAATE